MDIATIISLGVEGIEQLINLLNEAKTVAASNAQLNTAEEAAFNARINAVLAGPEWQTDAQVAAAGTTPAPAPAPALASTPVADTVLKHPVAEPTPAGTLHEPRHESLRPPFEKA